MLFLHLDAKFQNILIGRGKIPISSIGFENSFWRTKTLTCVCTKNEVGDWKGSNIMKYFSLKILKSN